MFIGAIIWFASCLYFGGYLGTPAYDETTITYSQVVTFFIAYAVVWILLLIFTFLRVNFIAAVLFFIAAGFTGFIVGFFLQWVSASIGMDLARTIFVTSSILAVGACTAAMLLGLAFKDTIAKHYCIIFILFGLFYTIFELLMIIIFNFNNLVIDLLIFGYIFVVIVFDTATLPGKIKRGYWMMAVVDIFFDFVAMLIRIFILLASSNRKK